ncbi:MAG: hypothetical protein KGL39_10825, partial [Patescibacteria group bacterium]|nr:hypothetical protein [Patescibacteria group bacterium]
MSTPQLVDCFGTPFGNTTGSAVWTVAKPNASGTGNLLWVVFATGSSTGATASSVVSLDSSGTTLDTFTQLISTTSPNSRYYFY